ncbi:MAG: reactive intermediate/imine deaminase [Planctomycetes bacterium]|nr:reactive intermediate/imine deaminase [Planctomycetota bacterium]
MSSCSSPSTSPTHRPAGNALGPYSASVTAGNTTYVSGQVSPHADFATEVRGTIAKVKAQLARAGLTLADVVAATVYLTDIGNYGAFNEIYQAEFPAPYPARACVAVKQLPANARVEIMVTATR